VAFKHHYIKVPLMVTVYKRTNDVTYLSRKIIIKVCKRNNPARLNEAEAGCMYVARSCPRCNVWICYVMLCHHPACKCPLKTLQQANSWFMLTWKMAIKTAFVQVCVVKKGSFQDKCQLF